MNIQLLFDKKNWVKLTYLYRNNKRNREYEKAYNENDRKVTKIGFYHIYCLANDWSNLVTDQLNHLMKSGLFSEIERLYCGVLIENSQISVLNDILKDYPKISILYTSTNGGLFEFRTLYEMYCLCKERKNFIGFYFHTKGISWLNVNHNIYEIASSWRLMNEYFMFDKYKIAVHSINSLGYEVYGTNYTEILNGKFKNIGLNFFWFDSTYVSKLDPLSYRNISDRSPSEFWICSKISKVYCPFKFSGNDRTMKIPPELYMECSFLQRFKVSLPLFFKRFNTYYKKLFNITVTESNPIVLRELEKQ